MSSYRFFFIVLLFSVTMSSCKKDAISGLQTNPNIVNGCEIIQTQIVQTNLNTQQIHSYLNIYQYDSLTRLIYMGDGMNNDTNHYHYNGHDCDGDHNSISVTSSDGYVISSASSNGSYQYSYDANGYLQLETYTDSVHHQGHNDSYTETFYWDNSGNLSYSVKLYQSQPAPVTTTYSYYTDKPYQVLLPTTWQKGKSNINLTKQITVAVNGSPISMDSYSYIFDGQGKVAQFTDLTQGQAQTVYTLTYSCH